jgi:AraC-like DNA-binding protein
MNTFLSAFIVGGSFLLCFLLYFYPLKQNEKANRWLSVFVFIIGTAFIGNYIETDDSFFYISKIINSLQFLLPLSLYISILYFVNPTSEFKVRYWLHFLPLAIYAVFENLVFFSGKSIATKTLFEVGDYSFFVRDLLPFLVLGYVVASYFALKKHAENLRLITAATQKTDLKWIRRFLLFLILPIVFWINDALSIFPFLLKLNAFIYAGSIFFLGFNAMRQGVIFPFKREDLAEISEVIESDKIKPRLSNEQVAALSVELDKLMEIDKIFLENEIDLPTVAKKLGISIHDASYLINKVTGDNFYSFINRHRVEEAKKLLISGKTEKLNMLGIAFESGFNSKTAFNTAFKKYVGISPSEYAKNR